MSDIHDKQQPQIAIERAADRGLVSPVVSAGLAILEKNPSPETLRELIAVQREWEANEARKLFTAALVGLKVGLPTTIAHDRKVSFNTTNYTHTSLAAAVEAVTPHLINHGFVHSWHPATNGANEVAVTCRLTHQAGHFEEVTLKAPPDAKGGKNGAQAVMSTVTMLERYTLLALLGIATADMGESQGEEENHSEPGKIDSARNLRAVGLLRKKGRTVEDAIAFIGRTVENWTEVDLDRLTAWARPAAKHATDCGVNAPGGGAPCDCEASA